MRYELSDDEQTIIDTDCDEELDLDQTAERLNELHEDVKSLTAMLRERELDQ